MARVMLGLAEALGIEGVKGIGHSYGSGVLLHMAVQRPDLMTAIVPVAGAHINRPGGGKPSDWGWEKLPPKAQERLLAMHPGGVPQVRTLFARLVEDFSPDISSDTIARERLQRTSTRTLLVLGDRDAFVPIELVLEAYRALPNAALWVIPGGGHGAIWNQEEAQAMFPGMVHRFFQGELGG
jgi:pimeloyl-ACP methyl ester carboxylesterase